MLNRVELIGRLTRAPELGYTPQGTAFCDMRVATNFQVNGAQRSEFHVVVAWNALAEQCARALTKGELVHVDGRMETESWENTGGRRQRVRIVAYRIMFLGPGHKSATAPSSTPAESGFDATSAEPEDIALPSDDVHGGGDGE
jgi:single-strand DNA-binding protein